MDVITFIKKYECKTRVATKNEASAAEGSLTFIEYCWDFLREPVGCRTVPSRPDVVVEELFEPALEFVVEETEDIPAGNGVRINGAFEETFPRRERPHTIMFIQNLIIISMHNA